MFVRELEWMETSNVEVAHPARSKALICVVVRFRIVNVSLVSSFVDVVAAIVAAAEAADEVAAAEAADEVAAAVIQRLSCLLRSQCTMF